MALSVLSAAPTTELDAVNVMLDAVNAAPVSSLSTPSLDVHRAIAVLRQVWREVLLQEWHFNSDYEFSLPRNSAGEVEVPANALRVAPSRRWPADLVVRGGKLWDRTTKSFVIPPEITFDILWLIPFEECPEAARNYITLRAARRFQERVLGDDRLGRIHERDELQALAILHETESATGRLNVSETFTIASVIQRNRGI